MSVALLDQIVYYYKTCHDYQQAHEIFIKYQHDIEWDNVTCSTMIQGIWPHIKDGWEHAHEMIDNMKKQNMTPTPADYNSYINMLNKAGEHQRSFNSGMN